MKKIVLFTITLCISAFMFSCKKCQECKTDTSQTFSGTTQNTSSTEKYCGDEYDDAPNTGTYSNSSGGVQQTVTVTCSDL